MNALWLSNAIDHSQTLTKQRSSSIMFDIIVLKALSRRQIEEGKMTIDHRDRIVSRVDALNINDALILYYTYLLHRTE